MGEREVELQYRLKRGEDRDEEAESAGERGKESV
jgi:hypothetical protein